MRAENLAFMTGLPDGCCQLIYADPPFFTGRTHVRGNGAQTLADHWPGGLGGYLEFLRPRLRQMHRLLADTGVLCLHLDWHASHYGRVLLDEVFGYANFLNEIVWSYRTGGVARAWFGRKHDTIFVYARRIGGHKFNLRREGTFRTDGLNHDEQGRPYKNTRAGRLYFNAAGPALTDVWDIPFLSTVSLERTGYPAQKPEALIARLIAAFSDENDVVADFFVGSGTTPAAARKLGRRFLACDRSDKAVRLARRRLSGTLRPAGRS
ncbi:MAG: site-specific DNA-methyltransferase [Planctomycetes bacterium]|nr:site-specific DNA-methyltransferase [Planctomycetota bacterium]